VVVAASKTFPGSVTERFFGSRVLAFFGKLSYGLYVYHGILAHVLVDAGLLPAMEGVVGNRTLAAAVFAGVGTVLSVAISLASYEFMEKRFLVLKDRFAS
jgi:peptidoglycan/LPS O-acetylase OafA/YrhL